MGSRPPIRAPTTSSISDTYKIPSTTRCLVKSLCRLSRDSLIELALKWLQEVNGATCAPYLVGNRDLEEEAEEDYLHTPAESLVELCNLYRTFKMEHGTKRDIVDRILDGDWRRGISLQQLAMIDFQHLQEHEASLRWTALKLVPLSIASERKGSERLGRQDKSPATEVYPRMQPAAFVQSLKHEISPLVKAHYYLHRLPAPHNLTILRLYVADTPYANPISSPPAHFTDSSRTMYIAFPDSCPYIYVALSGSSSGSGGSNRGAKGPKIDVTALKRTVLEAVPKALSRPQQRYALEATALTAKNLSTMCTLRGNGRGGASQGAFTVFSDAIADEGPLNVMKPSFDSKICAADEREKDSGVPESNSLLNRNGKRIGLRERDPNTLAEAAENRKQAKKRKIEVARRFGTTGLPDSKHSAPVDRLYVKLEADRALTGDESGKTRSTANVAEKAQTRSVLDAFDPRKHGSHIPSPAPAGYLAQDNSNAAPSSQTLTGGLTLTFHGADVFAGIRILAEMGFMNLDKMPAWMTGEEGVSTATVRDGTVVDGRGRGA